MEFYINKAKTISFSGHRPGEFDFQLSGDEYDLFTKNIMDIVIEEIESGYTNFMIGGEPGFDIICAEIIRIIKRIFPKIKLIIVLPYNDFRNSKHFDENWGYRYDSLIEDSYVISVTDQTNAPSSCFHERDKFIIDHSSKHIMYQKNKSLDSPIIQYAKKIGLSISNIDDFM